MHIPDSEDSGQLDPSKTETPPAEQRLYPRTPFNCPVTLTGDFIDNVEGQVVDISLLGSGIACEKTISKGTYVNLRFHLPHVEEPMKVDLAVARWSHEGKFGVEFIHINPEEQECLQRLLKFLQTATSP